MSIIRSDVGRHARIPDTGYSLQDRGILSFLLKERAQRFVDPVSGIRNPESNG